MFRTDEPEDVFVELVEALAHSMVPMLILTAVTALIGTYVFVESASVGVVAATGFGVCACLAKIAVILRHRRAQRRGGKPAIAAVRRREIAHALSTITVGVAVGLLTATIFTLADVSLHMTAISLLFGYCAGMVNRVSIRPRIAIVALVCAAGPGIAAAAAVGGTHSHFVLSAVFAGFLGGAIQTVTYVYETARRGVTLRLELALLARRDFLTGLHNRRGLREAFDALPRDGRGAVALHAFDLDGFKAVNDRLGHAAGDRLLQILSQRIRPIVPADAIVARTGGDEFTLVQIGVRDEEEARRLAERIHDQLSRPYDLVVDRSVRVGLSLGYALADPTEAELEDLTHRADAASYAAKRAGGGVRAHGEVAAALPVPDIGKPRARASI